MIFLKFLFESLRTAIWKIPKNRIMGKSDTAISPVSYTHLAAVRADFMGRFHQPLQCFILYEALRSFPIRARVKDSVVNTRYVALGSLNKYV